MRIALLMTCSRALFCIAVLTPAVSRAGDGVVKAAEAGVRSAPFDVAPEIARVHGGDRLLADDQAQGVWRRVRLPDGRYGFVRDADVQVTVAPRPTPAPAPAAAPTPGSQNPVAPAPAAPTAKVNVLELSLRGAPSADAPVLKVLPMGTAVVASPEVKDGWRRVELPEGQAGFVADAGLASGAPAAAAPAATSVPVVAAQPPAPAEPQLGPTLLGVVFEVMPSGTIATTVQSQSTVSNDPTLAYGVAPFIDFAMSPYATIGFSPQVIFAVKPQGAPSSSATEYDLRARLTGQLPIVPGAHLYGRLSPAYSVISMPAGTNFSSPRGFLVDLSVGVEAALVDRLHFVVDVGYQLGSQKGTLGSTNGGDVDVHTRYLHIGAGFAVAL
jgi:hypothetical protein